MLSFLLIVLLGIVVGVLVGLLPALPVFTGPFILYYFYNNLPLEHLLVFWLVVVTGSQFFGSVATITTGIPGEESSLVYINDLKKFSLLDKSRLLYSTAQGSLVAGFASTVFLYVCVKYVNISDMPWLAGLPFQITVYTLALLAFALVERRYIWTAGLVLLGLFIGPKQNYALPDYWYRVQDTIQGYTFYMLALGTMVIPDIVYSTGQHSAISDKFVAVKSRMFNLFTGIKSTLLGIVSGLVPGPSSSLSAMIAYKTSGPDSANRVISAETANNAAVITCAVPLLVLAVPINQNALIMSNIIDMKSIDIFSAILEPSFIPALTRLDIISIALLAALIVYYWLSTHLIDWYVKFIQAIHFQLKWLLVAVVTVLIGVDLYANEINAATYMLLLTAFTLLGLVLKRNNISPLPFLFAAILGDKLIWLYIQFFKIYL